MEAVTVTRRIDAPPVPVEDAIADRESFVGAAGFDEVSVDGDEIRVTNRVGVKDIELQLKVVEREDASFAVEQREGIFDEMWTTYTLTPAADGEATDVEAETEFALDVPVVGDILDSTVIRRQRRHELEAQFDWLAATAP